MASTEMQQCSFSVLYDTDPEADSRNSGRSALNTRALRRVHFYFPEGTTVPERVPTEQVGLFKMLQHKLFGTSAVPWRPSAHSGAKMREIDPLALTVDEKSTTGNFLVKPKNAGMIDPRFKKDEHQNRESEGESDEGESEAFDSELKYNYEGQAECSDNEDVKSEGDADEIEEDPDFKATRRRALRYHLKTIEATEGADSPRLSAKRRTRIVASARGQHRRPYPRIKSQSSDGEERRAHSAEGRLTSGMEHLSVNSDDPCGGSSSSSSLPRGSFDESVAFKVAHVLDQYTLLSKPTPTPPGTPGKIIRTRYRPLRVAEVLPGIE